MRTALALVLAAVFCAAPAFAQEDTVAANIVKATDLVLPSAPAFVLLDVNPSSITEPGFTKDLKLDLLVRGDRLAPDLAFTIKPIWLFSYQSIDASQYQAQTGFSRILSTLAVSLGTAKPDSLSRFAWALKLSLVRHDPLMDPAYIKQISDALDVSEDQLRLEAEKAAARLKARADSTKAANDPALSAAQKATAIAAAQKARADVTERADAQLQVIHQRIDRDVEEADQAYRKLNWNRPAVDVAFGHAYSYADTSLQDVDFEGLGMGAWLSASSGFGTRKWLFSSLVRLQEFENETSWFIGGNARFGNERFNAFAEVVAETGDSSAVNIAYGGEFEVPSIGKLEFGIRSRYDDDFRLRRLYPVVKVHWKLKDIGLPGM